MTECLRETWVDVGTGRETRRESVRDAWRDDDRDLVANSDPVELPADAAADICPPTSVFVFAIRPDWLDSPDGTLSYMDLVFRAADHELYRQQRDRVLGPEHNSEQLTLGGVADD